MTTLPVLTDRELQVLRLLWNGLQAQQIAKELKVSKKTVDAHKWNMFRKWHVTNSVQLIRAALEGRWLQVAQ